ncbi:AAA-16 domain-containing protein [Phanerochaete sordida]|uniref:AAA-16 domain-containing protein n=1 Tax=Phanerochaete sordida TaxID=48140 RepID=A0A9P3G4B5_9APHY|nr:AAA-16 domain-containing protein [Phanerochaete sordida]
MAPRMRGGEMLDTALDFASPVLDVLETGLDLVPVPGLGLIPKALSVIVDSVKVARANQESRNAFENKVKSLGALIESVTARAKTFANSYGGDEEQTMRAMDEIAHSRELQEAIAVLTRLIRELKMRVGSLQERRGVRGFVKEVFQGSRNEGILQDMQSELASAIEAFQLKSQLAIDRGIQEIKYLLQGAEQEKAIDKLAWADAGFRAVDHLKSGFMDGTRTNLFSDLTSWSAGRLARNPLERFYFLSGGAGLGKSAIAHRLCKHLSDGKISGTLLGASFFFVRGGRDNGSALLLFSTIARQLASHRAFQVQIAAACRKYTQQGDRQQIQYAFEELLLKPLTAASKSLKPDTRVVLVLDGLDECQESDLMTESLKYLFTLVRALPWLYVFAASRPEPHIMLVITSRDAAGIVHHQDLGDASASWGDVALYLQNTVPKIGTYAQFLRADPRPLRDLIQRAGGVFIFARIAVNVLDTYSDYPEEGFRLALSARGEELSPLDSLYLQILRAAFPRTQLQNAPRLHAHLRALLTLVALAQRPLPPGTLAALGHDLCQGAAVQTRLARAVPVPLGMAPRDVGAMLGRLRAALAVDAAGHVAPLHATFAEFLLDAARCSDALYHVERGAGHAGLAAVCLGALALENATDVLAACREERGEGVLYGRYVSTCFYAHLSRAAPTEELERLEVEFLRSAQLPVAFVVGLTTTSSTVEEHFKAWLDMIFGPPSLGDEESRGHQDEPQTPPRGSSLADEFIKFCAYAVQYLDHLRNLPDKPMPRITADDVRTYVVNAVKDHGSRGISDRVRSWRSDAIDIETYRTLCEKLKADIERDERTRRLWYDFSLKYWW